MLVALHALLVTAVAAVLLHVATASPAPCHPKAVVAAGNARFCVVSPHIIRMEWSATSSFRDARTLVVQARQLDDVPAFAHHVDPTDQSVTIRTHALQLVYHPSETHTFSDANLQVELLDTSSFPLGDGIWRPSRTDQVRRDALYGTLRTLDGVNGTADLDCMNQGPEYARDNHCTYGVISKKHGFVVLDDSLSATLDDDPTWPWLSPYVSATPDKPSMCEIDAEGARICGLETITSEQCTAHGCCYDATSERASSPFKCFYSTTSYQDLYFFGHGLDFHTALFEYSRLGGRMPLPPRFAFGVFYSRWWAYSDADLQDDIVAQYEQRGLPLDVLVVDMDWHLTFYKDQSPDQAGQPKGWTGYTWNKKLFPDPAQFMEWLHQRGLRVTLNLHPASGVQPWEDSYSEVAHAMGIDPATEQYVPFRLTNRTFADAWLTLSIGKREREGVDFWWLDWQQGEDWFDVHEARNDVNPTLWLNHVFSTNPHRWTNSQRPLILHRFGGLGSHRYPVGFSGDVVVSWESLRFQPLFTVMAANVGFGYWSHDLGGFQNPSEPELFTRWLQWGALSPMFRTHSSKDARSDRRIWKYPDPYYEFTRNAMLLRASMIPYTYNEARQLAFDRGLSVVHGVFLDWPEYEQAFAFHEQYMLGRNILVSPVVQPVDAITQLAKKSVWLPPGMWFDMTSGALVEGPIIYSASYALSELPWFVQAGTILPRTYIPDGTDLIGASHKLPKVLHLQVTPGMSSGRQQLYEDDGATTKYQEGAFRTTEFEFKASNGVFYFTIHPTQGSFDDMPTTRSYVVELLGQLPASKVELDGKTIPQRSFAQALACEDEAFYTYDARTLSVWVCVGQPRDVRHATALIIHLHQSDTHERAATLTIINDGLAGKFARLHAVKTFLDSQPVCMDDYSNFMAASAVERRVMYEPDKIVGILAEFTTLMDKALEDIRALASLGENERQRAIAFLSSPTFLTGQLKYTSLEI